MISEAKDTVMKKGAIDKVLEELPHTSYPTELREWRALVKAQAEISFKAGQESGKYSISTVVDVGNDAFKDGEKAGMKQGIWLFAWWKDGVQYVGTSGLTLEEAYKELGIE